MIGSVIVGVLFVWSCSIKAMEPDPCTHAFKRQRIIPQEKKSSDIKARGTAWEFVNALVMKLGCRTVQDTIPLWSLCSQEAGKTAYVNTENEICIFDHSLQRKIFAAKIVSEKVTCVSLSPNGTWCALGTERGSVLNLCLKKQTLYSYVCKNARPITRVLWSEGAYNIIDEALTCWHIEGVQDKKCVEKHVKTHGRDIQKFECSAHGSCAKVEKSGTIWFYNSWYAQSPEKAIVHRNRILDLAFHPHDPKKFAVSTVSGDVYTYDLDNLFSVYGCTKHEQRKGVHRKLFWHPEGEVLAVLNIGQKIVDFISLNLAVRSSRMHAKEKISAFAWDMRGSNCAVGFENQTIGLCDFLKQIGGSVFATVFSSLHTRGIPEKISWKNHCDLLVNERLQGAAFVNMYKVELPLHKGLEEKIQSESVRSTLYMLWNNLNDLSSTKNQVVELSESEYKSMASLPRKILAILKMSDVLFVRKRVHLSDINPVLSFGGSSSLPHGMQVLGYEEQQ